MNRHPWIGHGILVLTAFVLLAGCGRARPDLASQPTLYVVGYAHLDTEWRWDYVTTIREYLPKTFNTNFELFEKYPDYVFNFSGANRYRMIKEYYPAAWERLKGYVEAGRWFPCGSAMEESDVNSPSAESLIRQVLYGTKLFRDEFGFTSAEYMLPDCFGFPASLPSILAHCGIKGFSTQKLTWGSAAPVGGPGSPEETPVGIPFNVGFWEGLDGRGVIAALNPGSYGGQVSYDLSTSPDPDSPQARRFIDWPARIDRNGKVSGVFADYMYYGTGDTGGSPREASVALLQAIVTRSEAVIPPPGQGGQRGQPQPPPEPAPPVVVGTGPVRVISARADELFTDITPRQAAGLPRYKGDLELTNHSAGSLTSQAYVKRWNRQNEVLADAAERASVAAAWTDGRPYPLKRLNDAWTLVTGAQFHDIIPGTSIPKAYEYAWNDQLLALNQFAAVLTSAVEGVAAGLDTRVEGIPVVVYNPLEIPREDVVEAAVTFPGGTPAAVRVFGPDGREVPAQLRTDGRVLFTAALPPVGWAVFEVRAAAAPSNSLELKVTSTSLENARYRVRLDRNGDVAGIFDKAAGRELLAAPLRLAVSTDNPAQWPAWNMDWEDQSRAPRAWVGGPARMRVVESGPVRVAVEIDRRAEGSRFIQTIRLAAGSAGDRLEIGNRIDWRAAEANLKAVFPLTVANESATYNWDIGTIQRSGNDERKFEVPSHQWIDLTDRDGSYGVTVLTDCKNGSDKPDERTLRLTLMRTPGTRGGYPDQGSQDWGRHEFLFGLAGHAGTRSQAGTDWQAWRLNQPLVAFTAPRHEGTLGRSFSLLNLSSDRVRVLALKGAERGDEVILRLVELDGVTQSGVRVAFAAPLAGAREVDGQEMPVGRARLEAGVLVTDLAPFQVRSFALRLGRAPAPATAPGWRAVDLPLDRVVASRDSIRTSAGFTGDGQCLPAEMLPAELPWGDIRFRLAPAGRSEPEAVTARGQTIQLPEGTYDRLYLLAASADGDRPADFRVGTTSIPLTVQDWGGYIGQWDNRIWKQVEVTRPADPIRNRPARTTMVDEFAGLEPAYVKRAPVAWFASHHHDAEGVNQPYAYAYLYAYCLEVPAGARTLTLPNDPSIRILAVTVSGGGVPLRPVQPLYDVLARDDGGR
jgi:alpha-mannosidase